ncbi:hypothetical protein FGG08_006186 [Glutinoglossum americanum]|uniref:Uncharacterized protein n=1 Tax=Glutinoglossum americanum TaxID=1670608 RepID=A0A9P8I3Z6_9PEZI|nr:hypothetical protein FGG08_006186 [Glutinoglossum americanum]
MPSHRSKPIIISAEPSRTSSPARNLNYLSPPRLPATGSSRSHYPPSKSQAHLSPYSNPDPGSYSSRPAEESPYYSRPGYGFDTRNFQTMSNNSSRSTSPGSHNGERYDDPGRVVEVIGMPHGTGGRLNGGPAYNERGYERISHGNNVIHNYGAGYLDPDRAPANPPYQQYQGGQHQGGQYRG